MRSAGLQCSASMMALISRTARARQIAEQADEEGYPLCEKPVTTAINEVAAGKLTAENIDTHIAK